MGRQVLFDDSGVAWGIKATMDGVPQASCMHMAMKHNQLESDCSSQLDNTHGIVSYCD